MRRFLGRLLAGGGIGVFLWPLLAAAQTAAQTAAPTPTPAPGSAAGTGESAEELAKKLSNPVAALISVPFQNNFEFGIGEQNGFRWTLNFQPVGPVMYWPSATDERLGSQKWGAGPTALLLKQDGPWTYGILANHIWSFADAGGGDDRSDLSNTFLQPFLAYNTKSATTYTVNTETSYDWIHRQWTVPINVLVSQLVHLGKLPVSIGLGGKYYAEKPANGPDWGIRFVFTILLPK